MSDQLQLRGGPTAQSEIFVGAEREITVDTGLKRLRIHDGSTPGGHILSGKVDLDTAVATINQTIDANEAADAQARADLKVLLEQELADSQAEDAAARAVIQAAIDAEVATSAAYDITQDNRIAVLEAVNNISKKELDFITLIGSPSPAAGQVGVNSFTPSYVGMIVLPNIDVNGNTVTSGDFLQDDRIALKQTHGAAAVYFVADAFTFGDHIRINVYEDKTILGAGGDLAYIENNEVSAVFEDNSVTRGAMTAGFSTEATARETAVASLTTLITALQTRATALEVDPVTKTYVDTQLNDLVNGAPDALNQLNEIIAAFEGADTNLISDLSGLGVRITALETDTTSATAVAAVQADVDANETAINASLATETAARISGDAATLASANTYTDTSISSLVNGADLALDTLKEIGDALSAGDTSVTTALTASITTESTARTSADTALSGRLDTLEGQTLDTRITALEADPTTQTLLTAETTARTSAITTVQADVDQNEADADAAIAANTALITAEETARIAADLAETTARNTAISSEATTRAAADAAETTARQNAITAEENARIAADNTLTTNLATTNTNLTATNTAYAAADTNLQTQITSINTVEAAMEARNLRAGLCFGQLYVETLTVA